MDKKILKQQVIELIYNNLPKDGITIDIFNDIVNESYEFIKDKIKEYDE